ncbi:MAG: hypothetical protein IT537_03265 [Hyphomicrobiales bacterium]|nr:hypothetical protein [Hyphomicrobiales bacterium]
MSLRTALKTLLGTAWHVQSENVVDQMTPEVDGTVEAGKAVVPDSNKDVTGLRNVGATGTLGTNSVTFIVPASPNAKLAGSGAGWVLAADDAVNLLTLPASQTSEVVGIAIPGLQVGDIVTAVGVVGQVESAGGNVTLAMDVRKHTAAAADVADASLGTDNVGTLTADTILSAANLGVTGLTETMAADEMLYVNLTGTTAGSTDIAIMALVVTVTRTR